ncbi:hypothetical protein D8771_08810 [Streptomyces albus]|uniref:Uncharacterized protein n=1 Tax=Streptomyces albus TaxID=1888 RepID=A0A8H1LJA2_9ACTN|nr:hypothetical protein ADL27_04165 [Streptomyces sp. NRRL F-6602]TGG86431.1 hypothetical protein D8771_08810 [Streptomyces albus]
MLRAEGRHRTGPGAVREAAGRTEPLQGAGRSGALPAVRGPSRSRPQPSRPARPGRLPSAAAGTVPGAGPPYGTARRVCGRPHRPFRAGMFRKAAWLERMTVLSPW